MSFKKKVGLTLLALGVIALLCAAATQFPSQRFRKVTAEEVDTKAFRLSTEPGAGRILTSDSTGNGFWEIPLLPPDVGWHHTDDGSNITSLYRRLVVGGPAIGTERLLVQGFSGSDYVGDLIEPSYAFMDEYAFASSPSAWRAFDNDMGRIWAPTDSAPWIALHFMDGAHQINRVRLRKFTDDQGQGVIRFPWDQFVVYGSNDSTNGVDGNWIPISPTFTVQHISEWSHDYDFPENKQSFAWLKLAGQRSVQPANLWVNEMEAYAYLPTPAKKFLVDELGNPWTDGTMTAGAITLTSGAQPAVFDADDVQRWNALEAGVPEETDPVFSSSPAHGITSENIANWEALSQSISWHPIDSSRTTSDYRRVIIGGRDFDSPHRLLVQGFEGETYSDDLAKKTSSTSYSALYDGVYTSSGYGNRLFDDTISYYHTFGLEEPRWVAVRFIDGNAKKVNRIAMYRNSAYAGLPWTTFNVLGSNNSTNAVDGDWTYITSFSIGDTIADWNCFDFNDNNQYFNWVKVEGPPNPSVTKLSEMSVHSFAPIGANNFWVDGTGNPGTDGAMSASTFKFNPLAAAPDAPDPGTAYFDNVSHKVRVWDGSAWQDAW